MLAENYKLLYLAQFFRMFMDVTTVGIRSALSKLVSSNDTGKVRKAFSSMRHISLFERYFSRIIT